MTKLSFTRHRSPSRRTALSALALALSTGWAWAEKPDGAGGGRGKEERGRKEGPGKPDRKGPPERQDRGDRPDRAPSPYARQGGQNGGQGGGFRFSDEDRRMAGDYYVGQARQGHCPPGLARKGKGCMPPGQARKWQRGMPLPRDLRVYEVPVELRVRLPVPPPNHRYVQVAGDILLIAIGTSIVVDALEDLLR